MILMGLAESCGVKPVPAGQRGTNLLVDDRGLDTLVIKTAEHMTAVRQLDEVTLEADAGILLNHLAVYAQQHGLSGLEFAHGIPGSLRRGRMYERRSLRRRDASGGDGGDGAAAGGACGASRRRRRPSAIDAAPFSDTEAVVLGARAAPDHRDDPRCHPAADGRAHGPPPASLSRWSIPAPAAPSSGRRATSPGRSSNRRGLKGLTVGGAQVSDQARGLCHQRGRRYQRRRGGVDPAGAAGGVRRPRRASGAGGADRRTLRKETSMEILIISGLSGGGKEQGGLLSGGYRLLHRWIICRRR